MLIVDTVKDAYSDDGRPLLVLDRAYEGIEPGTPVHAILDWDHRYKQMRLHSTVHMHHCMMEKILGHRIPNPATSDLQDDGTAYNRYETKEVTQELVEKANAEFVRAVAEGAPISTRDDEEKEGFRWWDCLGYSIPCGGTHLRDLSEIGKIEVAFSQRKGKPKVAFSLA